MEYVNDINIQEAVIHILDSNGIDPVLNEFTLELTEDIYKFLYRHIEKCFKDEELKTAVFKEERNIVKEIVQDYLNGVDHDIVNLSKELARQLFAIMNGNTNIPSCDLIVVSLITDQGPMIGILKMDYVKNYTHQVDFVEDKIGIGIVPQMAGLPGSGQRIQKAAFIKPIREDNKFDFDKFEIIPDMIEEDDEVETLDEIIEEPQETINVPKNMAEFKKAIENKDEKAIDKALETFAINEKTGVIDLNKAISIVTNNAVNEAVKCIMNETDFDKDMSKYDITGRKVA